MEKKVNEERKKQFIRHAVSIHVCDVCDERSTYMSEHMTRHIHMRRAGTRSRSQLPDNFDFNLDIYVFVLCLIADELLSHKIVHTHDECLMNGNN